MKVEIIIEKSLKEPLARLYVEKMTAQIERTRHYLEGMDESVAIIGIRDDKVFPLKPEDIYCFFSKGPKVFAMTDQGDLWVKSKLYQLEGVLSSESFLRISNACLANTKKIRCFEASIGGNLTTVFTNGSKEYVSRRNVSNVKAYFGL